MCVWTCVEFGFVFEKAVDKSHQRQRRQPGIVNAVGGVERQLPGFGRKFHETAGLQIIEAAFDVRRFLHFFERTEFFLRQRRGRTRDDARLRLDQQIAVRFDESQNG